MQRPIFFATTLLVAVTVTALATVESANSVSCEKGSAADAKADRNMRLEDKDQRASNDPIWDLARDFKIDGKLEDTQKLESSPLQLNMKGAQLSGHFVEKKVRDEINDSVFSGEIVTREKPLLILRQQANKDGTYVVIHAGHVIGENHYRGAWHDNSGQSGDFELKLRK